MASSAENENDNGSAVAHDFRPLIRVYKDGRVERLLGTATVPAGLDAQTGVDSKDVKISDALDTVSARLYLPKFMLNNPEQDPQLPLLIYFHGGGFCIETAFSPTYHNHLNLLASQANVVVVSVDYRRAPEFPLPVAYDDSWAAIKWVINNQADADPWLNDRIVDYSRVFIAGDSAGANIAHHMAIRAGIEGINVAGAILVHPFFSGVDPIGGNEADRRAHLQSRRFVEGLWRLVCPNTRMGLDDPLVNPSFDPRLKLMGSKKVLIFVADKDSLRGVGFYYKEVLDKSGWAGAAEVVEAKGEGHVFHLFNPSSESAVAMMKKLVVFLNQS
ncbi:hypothetical protein Nepgr_004541 [Nepenthes gracilis]|uniref:Alpha/beta hydrolase fold-3 domain-containing protein n=1 Tax=Nepenthes gracilis TaxID=150966 RepID=A0AAD3S1J8_NEPGR|nr:hypothetical protein Nepgr_004541 [Nepenthes gracilis]